jgi:hypothetical protein
MGPYRRSISQINLTVGGQDRWNEGTGRSMPPVNIFAADGAYVSCVNAAFLVIIGAAVIIDWELKSKSVSWPTQQ